jgi:hypothetical protein
MRGEKRFVFEIMRDNGNRMVASSDEHKKAKGAAKAGKRIWKRDGQDRAAGKARSIRLETDELSLRHQ